MMVQRACSAYEEAMWVGGGTFNRNRYLKAALTAALAPAPQKEGSE